MKRLADQSLYEILEVREDAPASEIAAACDRAREIYGPGSLATYTLMTSDEAELLTKRIDEARATLLDPDARARYDGTLHRAGEAVAAGRAASMASVAAAAVASASGGAGSLASLPPVIPALKIPEPMAAREPVAAPVPVAEVEESLSPESAAGPGPFPAPQPEEEAEEEAEEPEPIPSARPAILLAAAVGSASALDQAHAPPEPPSPQPILLQRELPPPRVAEAAAPAAPAPPAPAPEAAAPPAAVPLPVVADGAWTGEALRQAREARGLTVQQIAERTKVTRHHIDNIEGERFGALPAPVYLRGILLSIARELRLDGQKVARAFLERAAAAQSKPR